MAHTPGPWAAYPPEFTDGKCWTVQTDSGMTVRVCGGDTPENGGNARLIAAAPELLALLNRMVQYVDEYPTGGYHMNDVLKQCRDTIAKAEGRGE